MPTITIQSNKSRSQLRAEIYGLPRKMRSPDFMGLLTHGVFRRLHSSFLTRSVGGQDQYGGNWAPLSPARRRFKSKRRPGSEATINIFTGRLINSFQPSPRTRGGYSPGRDQLANISPGKAELGSKVPYAKYVNAQRNLLPDNMTQLISDALGDALQDYIE